MSDKQQNRNKMAAVFRGGVLLFVAAGASHPTAGATPMPPPVVSVADHDGVPAALDIIKRAGRGRS